jgi:hypothetical protein
VRWRGLRDARESGIEMPATRQANEFWFWAQSGHVDQVPASEVGGYSIALPRLGQICQPDDNDCHSYSSSIPGVFLSMIRLCGAYVPDLDRTLRLRGNDPRLSTPCYEVFFPPQNGDPRRRFQNQSLPPGYDYDR